MLSICKDSLNITLPAFKYFSVYLIGSIPIINGMFGGFPKTSTSGISYYGKNKLCLECQPPKPMGQPKCKGPISRQTPLSWSKALD